MKRLLGILFSVAALLAICWPSQAQVFIVNTCGTVPTSQATLVPGSAGMMFIDSTGKLCVNATVSASVSPFTPGASGARGTQLAVTTADSSGTLPTNGGAVVVTNTGANPMFCNVNGIAATTSDQEISSGGGWFNFGIPTGITALHCIATGGSTTANMLGGSGLATGTGGGGGGGSGGTVTQGSPNGGGVNAWPVVDSAVASALNTASLCQGLSSEQAAVTTANPQKLMCDLIGKMVTSPYANRELMARGAVTLSGTSAGTILAASGSASLKEYITDLTCTRNDAGTTAVSITLNDTATTIIDLPNNGGGGGYAHTFNVPLAFAANVAATATSGTSITSIHCSATGFYGY